MKKTQIAGQALVDEVVEQAQSKKAGNIAVLDLRDKTAPADFFVICEGESTVQNRAISDAVEAGLKQKGSAPWHSEGRDQARWVVLDYVDVVVHVMLPDVREIYDLESLWRGNGKEKANE